MTRPLAMPERPFTPETLAERWQCSPNTVRRMCKRNQLRAFRLGGKLWRIPADAVEDYECRQSSDLLDIEADTPSSTTRTESVTGIRLARMIEQKHGLNSRGS